MAKRKNTTEQNNSFWYVLLNRYGQRSWSWSVWVLYIYTIEDFP